MSDTLQILRVLPSKCSVCVDDPEGVVGSIHDLPGTNQIENHWNAEEDDQCPQGYIHSFADVAPCGKDKMPFS